MGGANLAAIPTEITRQILRHVARGDDDGAKCWPGQKAAILRLKGESLWAIQSLRLTCKALSEIATPMLFSALRVCINPWSIEIFEALSKNPVIAAHCHCVVVNVATYAQELVGNVVWFKKSRLRAIDDRFTIPHLDMQGWRSSFARRSGT